MAEEISDQELESRYKAAIMSVPIEKLTDEELDQRLAWAEETKQQPTEEKPWYGVSGKGLVAGALKPFELYEEYAAKPFRKLVTGKETGTEIAESLGASTQTPYKMPDIAKEYLPLTSSIVEKTSPADIYGLGIDIVSDPLSVAGMGKAVATKAAPVAMDAAESASKYLLKFMSKESKALPEFAEGASGVEVPSSIKMDYSNIPLKNETNIPVGQKTVEVPRSIQDLEKFSEIDVNMPSKERMLQATAELPDLQFKPTAGHAEMLKNPRAMTDIKAAIEKLPEPQKQGFLAVEQSRLNELSDKTKSLPAMIHPEAKPISEAGLDFINEVKTMAENKRTELEPLFKELKSAASPIEKSDAEFLIERISDDKNLGKIFEWKETAEGESKLSIKPFNTKFGMSKQEYSDIVQVLKDLEDGATFEEIQKVREYLRKQKDPKNPKATEALESLRKSLLGELETMASSDQTREVFKQWAVNEKMVDDVEKVIGGQIENLDKLYAANPDKVVQKVLANTNNAEVVKNYIGEDQFNKLISSWVKSGVDSAFDPSKGMLPHALKNWIKKNNTNLNRYVSPDVTKRLNALADLSFQTKRFLDSVNPSGTAFALNAMWGDKLNASKATMLLDPTKILQTSADLAIDSMKNARTTRQAQEAIDLFFRDAKELNIPKEQLDVMASKFIKKYPHFVNEVMNGLQSALPLGGAVVNSRVGSDRTYKLEPQELQSYIEQIMQDDGLGNVEKARRRSLANKYGIGIADFTPMQPLEQQAPPQDVGDLASKLQSI